ncbi:hypothetical protein [Acinetobacter venetianus]|uniref:hypothetical protein n=1 Tax=Acinetobacter venetianus TaxID=52133 RepID=UPI000362020A|nr:hypothetical protein [Acinetobacter venetianus]
MANQRVFELQYSRFSIVLQLLIFLGISFLSYLLLKPLFFFISFLFMCGVWVLFFKQSQIKKIENLEKNLWSVEFSDPNLDIQQREIVKIIDHHCYIVIYFSDPQHKNLVIWWDQLAYFHWKNLKILVKLA